MEFILNNLSLLAPELIISAGILLLVIADLIFDKNKGVIFILASVLLSLALIFVFRQIDLSERLFSVFNISDKSFYLLSLDNFAVFFKFLILISSLFIVVFASHSEEIKNLTVRTGEFITLIFGMVLGMMLMAMAEDLIMMYIAMELLSLSSYVLAGFIRNNSRNSEASIKYLIYGSAASGVMLFGISLIYGLAGTTNFLAIKEIFTHSNLSDVTGIVGLLFILTGIGFKISLVPFHFWTPDIYEGSPITISAYLSVASKAAGFALFIRLIKNSIVTDINDLGVWTYIDSIDWQGILIALAILTMTIGNFTALWQNNLKRLLAYSSIAHAGYIMLGLVVFNNQGVNAIFIYFLIYMFMNIGAFYIVMIASNKTGSEDIETFKGFGLTNPFLGISLSIFMISLVGLPPTAGFIGKLYIFLALIDSNLLIVALIALLNTVVSLYYYVRVLKFMFINESADKTSTPIQLSIPQIIFPILLLIPIILFGIYFTPIAEFTNYLLSMN